MDAVASPARGDGVGWKPPLVRVFSGGYELALADDCIL
jgi:hypothetical protein